ncbi:hypothetical protein [Parasedimentitalea marina]|uniref:hypothetical protein n=1 Tax=Parasedimentitalea marina TaxID=2483033 RepID=UPI000FD8C81F|nr:hypothetical protein [Parasedimentitalea marina]
MGFSVVPIAMLLCARLFRPAFADGRSALYFFLCENEVIKWPRPSCPKPCHRWQNNCGAAARMNRNLIVIAALVVGELTMVLRLLASGFIAFRVAAWFTARKRVVHMSDRY